MSAVRIIVDDCRAALAALPAESVQCVVTSPPYWGLRDYGVDGQIGLEASIDAHIAALVDVFRAVRRVLRKDGTCWVNYGDAYASSVNGRSAADTKADGKDDRTFRDKPIDTVKASGLKPKDLIGLPWRLAFALQADGWWLRRDIIWHKPNPMPESTRDRPTTAHEYIFLLTKNGGNAILWRHRDGRISHERPAPDLIWRHRVTREETRQPQLSSAWMQVNLWEGGDYFYDADAIRTDWTSGRDDMRGKGVRTGDAYLQQGAVASNHNRARYKMPDGWDTGDGGHQTIHRAGREKGAAPDRGSREHLARSKMDDSPDRRKVGFNQCWEDDDAAGVIAPGANARSVWTIPTEGFKGAHFATFPTELARRCILAGSRIGDVILDPFGGAGTTGLVAAKAMRDAILIELNPDYAAIAHRRLKADLVAVTGGDPQRGLAPTLIEQAADDAASPSELKAS